MLPVSDSAEWLEVDGLGGYASGTTSGIRTRRYHALLLTATKPPAERKTLLNGFEAWIETGRGNWFLSSQRYAPDVIYPDGVTHIKTFILRPWPTWRFELGDNLAIEQELSIQSRHNHLKCRFVRRKRADIDVLDRSKQEFKVPR